MTTQELIPIPDIEALALARLTTIAELVGTAESLTITTNDEYVRVDELLGAVKAAFKEAESERTELKAPSLARGQAIDAAYRPAKEAYEKGERVIRAAMVAFVNKREREAAERAAKIRQQEETARQRLLTRAETAEERGQDTKADTLREQAMAMPVVSVAPDIPKTATTMREEWAWELLDKTQVKANFLVLDETAINALVKSMGERAADTVGGIHVFKQKVAVRRGR